MAHDDTETQYTQGVGHEKTEVDIAVITLQAKDCQGLSTTSRSQERGTEANFP